MEIWKTLRVSHIPTPPAATTDKCLTRRYTNIPLGTKDRSRHGCNERPAVLDQGEENVTQNYTLLHRRDRNLHGMRTAQAAYRINMLCVSGSVARWRIDSELHCSCSVANLPKSDL